MIAGWVNLDSWASGDDLIVGLSIFRMKICIRVYVKEAKSSFIFMSISIYFFAYTILFTADCSCLFYVCISIFNVLSSSSISYCCTTLTCANHNNLFNWCCQTPVSIGSIMSTDEETTHLIYALFFPALVTMRIAADIVNVVTLMILLYMPSKSTMLFPDWTKKNFSWHF